MISNPDTQNRTASANKTGGLPRSPRRAIQAAIGARLSETPSQKCASVVKRLLYEYPKSHNSTGTERYNGQRLGRNRRVEATKASEQTKVKTATERTLIRPAGR